MGDEFENVLISARYAASETTFCSPSLRAFPGFCAPIEKLWEVSLSLTIGAILTSSSIPNASSSALKLLIKSGVTSSEIINFALLENRVFVCFSELIPLSTS